MRKMTCLGTKRSWSFTADHQIFGAKVEILFRSFHWKIPCTNGNSEKVVPFSRLGRSEWKFVYHLQVSWVSYWFHVVTQNPAGIQSSAVRQSGNFRQMVNDTYRSYGPNIPNQNFRNFFINGKQPCFRFSWWNLSVPSLTTFCLVATECTSSSRQISETHVKPFKVTLKFSFKAQWI